MREFSKNSNSRTYNKSDDYTDQEIHEKYFEKRENSISKNNLDNQGFQIFNIYRGLRI